MKNTQPHDHRPLLDTLTGGESSLPLVLISAALAVWAIVSNSMISMGLFVCFGAFLVYRKIKRLPSEQNALKRYYWVQIFAIAVLVVAAIVWYFWASKHL